MRCAPDRSTLAALLLLGGCGVLDPTYQAPPGPDAEPHAIVEPRFVGNDEVGTYLLRGEIEDYLYDLSRQPERETLAFDAGDDLTQLYESLGYPDAEVDYEVERLPAPADGPPVVVVRFLIDEGPLVVVQALDLVGNEVVSDDELGAMWQRQQSGVLGLGEPIFVHSQLQGYAQDIQRFYHSLGYLDAVVAEPEIERLPDRSAVVVRIRVEEGRRYRHGPVVVGDELVAGLGEDPPSPPDGIYRRRKLQDYALDLRAKLQNLGFPDPVVRVETTKVPEELRVDARIQGTPGRRAKIGEVVVIGNERTNTGTILAKMPLGEGDRYDGSKEEEGLRKLYLSGLFRRVRLEHVWTDDDTIRLEIHVDEVESRSVELLVGYGSYELARGGVRFEEINVFGTGRQFTSLARLSTKGYRLSSTITDPFFLGTETSVSLGGEFFRREEPAFTDEALGATLAASRRLARGLTSRVGYSYRDRTDAFAETMQATTERVDYTEGRLFLELRHDRRDNPLFPRTGHEQFVVVDGMDDVLLADVSFARTRIGATAHLPLWASSRLVLRTEQGWLWPNDESADIPLQERFYNGGESTVRSFQEAELGPKDATGTPIGGEYFNLFSVELRQPVWKTLEVAAFVDAGNVGRDVYSYGLSKMRYGIGGGLRLVLPIGPLRLDAGWNPERERGEDEWVVHFSVGYPF